ncbi:NADP-dependent phosphogluconate dehydrogenase [Shimia sp. R11_0]|uniref:NADP-dependent phosphogluconate dehydrogenase n=1 Tax=Shimia sp. R11_0 TaxID=2821096 RepID=UPI001AD999D7|nr:NADP-dependent phosphogluconate dehydrogenase [Shimia sp. R11_0]MBO9476735.1 NADP-dependent phosphogluconate dehydrogenase [Shimia sp. R11_0]
MEIANFGLYGLGTMGGALAQNIADKGFHLHVASYKPEDTERFVANAGAQKPMFTGHRTLAEMTETMPGPRAIIMLIPAGAAIDDSIAQAKPHMRPGDVLIDAGNSDFHDTRRRAQALEAEGLGYMGMGVSGGEEGARKGPAMMVGGTESVWKTLRPMLEAIAADFEGTPCVDRVGPDGAGHFVKTVHNGIEYADMQILAETYGLMRNGMSMTPPQIGDVFATWNEGRLQSYLVEISAEVLRAIDPATDKPILDMIVDTAGQKGTGRWTAIEAQKLGVSASTIEAAVGARIWSAHPEARHTGQALFEVQRGEVALDTAQLEQAILAARILSHSQGFGLLSTASQEFDWSLKLARCAEIWRAGCIIRSRLLSEIAQTYEAVPSTQILAFAPAMVPLLETTLPALRTVVAESIKAGHPIPVMTAALAWFDGMTQARGTADLIQGQRDFFGRHGFARLDGGTGHHGPWDS